ncbi:hypothetical protein LIER_22913 [Lithospermum erythrorhizon]|uniref:Uncharacterized protein n=1 Tax=Lithospermum erythrorhizon TaxID=34254 RepID=A0AAV3QVI3_LITER
MARTKRTAAVRHLSPLKRSKSAKFASLFSSPPSTKTAIVELISPTPSPKKATHDTLLPLLDQEVVSLGPASNFLPFSLYLLLILFSFSEAASAFKALPDGNITLYQKSLQLGEELSQAHLKVKALDQELQGLRL